MGGRDVSGFFHLSCFCGNRIDFGISIHPEIFYFGRTFRSEPGYFRDCDETVLFQKSVPFVHATFESDVVDSSFRPDKIEFFVLEREMIHRPGDSFHSVRAKGFCRIFIEYFNKVREKVYACDLSLGVLCQCDGLSAGTTADVGYL